MTPYSVLFSRRARSYLRRIQPHQQRQIRDHVRRIASDPQDTRLGSALRGRMDDLHRARVGDIRVLYYVRDQIEVIEVTRIGPRGDVYKDL